MPTRFVAVPIVFLAIASLCEAQDPFVLKQFVGGPALHLGTGDINGDGYVDLAYSGIDLVPPDDLSVHLGLGDGTLAEPITTVTPLDSIDDVLFGDFNEDGLDDLAVASGEEFLFPTPGAVSIFLSQGDGTLGAPFSVPMTFAVRSMEVGDVDGDGHLDVVTQEDLAGNIWVHLGDGLGGLTYAGAFFSHPGAGEIALADLNEDGMDDIVAAGQANKIAVFLASGGGSFHPKTLYGNISNGIRQIVATDINGDMHVDVLTPSRIAGVVEMRLGDGTGALGPKTTIDVGPGPVAVIALDADADGVLDLLVDNEAASPDPYVAFVRGIDGTTFAAPEPFFQDVIQTMLWIEAADFDGDGADDFIVSGDVASGHVMESVLTPWAGLGGALGGNDLPPSLLGTGSLAFGSAGSLSLTNAPPSSMATLVIGLSELSVAFKGGVLIPTPDVLITLPTDAAGELTLPWASWPVDVASDLWFQAWVVDPTGPKGLTATSALRASSPGL